MPNASPKRPGSQSMRSRKKQMPKAKAEIPMTTYYVQRHQGRDQKVTVPSHWKVTFGPLNPGTKGSEGNGAPALRFYEAANKQRMVITGVLSFRDIAIKVEEKRTTSKQQTLYKGSGAGRKEVVVEGRMDEWVDADKPEQGDPDFFRIGTNQLSGPIDPLSGGIAAAQ